MGWGVRRRGGLYSKLYRYDEHFEGLLGPSLNSSTFRSEREQRWIAQRDGENVGRVFCSEGIENGSRVPLSFEAGARVLGIGHRL
jgi:hypothetical protein